MSIVITINNLFPHPLKIPSFHTLPVPHCYVRYSFAAPHHPYMSRPTRNYQVEPLTPEMSAQLPRTMAKVKDAAPIGELTLNLAWFLVPSSYRKGALENGVRCEGIECIGRKFCRIIPIVDAEQERADCLSVSSYRKRYVR